MKVIIVCHTEFGYTINNTVVYSKDYIDGVRAIIKLQILADKYDAKITFAIMPEVAQFIPKNIKHEIGLHVHPGYQEINIKGFSCIIGDEYIKKHGIQSINSINLRDYVYEEQLEMIKVGKEYLENRFGRQIRSFVSGRWSVNNDTIRSLVKTGITHDCSTLAHSKSDHYDYSKIPRLCQPYHPSKEDYQKKGDLPVLIVPISQIFPKGHVSPELVPLCGLSWLKACFLEYYMQNMPVFHICLHSPCLTNSYYISVMNDLLRFISRHRNVEFEFASDILESEEINPKTQILPYIYGINKCMMKTALNRISTYFKIK